MQDNDPQACINIDKSWHAIQFLLTGLGWGDGPPLSLVISGGVDTGPDLGYGPGRLLEPSQVKAVSLALDGLSVDALAERYNPEGMWEEDGNRVNKTYREVV